MIVQYNLSTPDRVHHGFLSNPSKRSVPIIFPYTAMLKTPLYFGSCDFQIAALFCGPLIMIRLSTNKVLRPGSKVPINVCLFGTVT